MILRGILLLGLCVFVALTSVTLAVARGAPQPVGTLILCTDAGVTQVTVDARGQPVAPPHACPDCLLAFHATVPRDPLPAMPAALRPLRHYTGTLRHAASLPRPMQMARAPPHPV